MNVFTTNLKIQTQTSRVLKLHLTRQQITGCAQVSSIYGDNYVILKLNIHMVTKEVVTKI